jgi:predicted ATP-grasp superfamily ATP-dependent carboligase
LVTDGENRAALAITRSLGRQGHRIVVGEKRQPSLAQVSRYCAESVTYPDPVLNGDAFVDALLRTVRDRAIDIVIPVAEITTALIVGHKSAFEPDCRVPFPDVDAFNRAANKVEVITLAQELGIPTPWSVVLAKRGDVPATRDELRFPIVVKPHRSRVLVNGRWCSTSVTYATTAMELEAILDAKDTAEYPVLLQERIVGPGMGVFLCYDRGQPVAVFSHKRLREKPPSGGVSVLCESVPVLPQAKAYATALLDRLKWRGVAMVEFKLDHRDNTPKLMEINGRFWGSLQLAIDAGVDFPGMLLCIAMGEPVAPVESYRIGAKSRWLLGDLDALMMRLFKGDDVLHLGPGHPGKVRAVAEFLKFVQRDMRYETWSRSDMRPALHEAARWFTRHA